MSFIEFRQTEMVPAPFPFARFPFESLRIAVIGAVVLVGAGCGGGVASTRPPGDGGTDHVGDVGAEVKRPAGMACPPVTAGEKRGLGACCTTAGDCAGGVCWNGFCTKTCAATADCGAVVAPSPLPVGVAMSCATNLIGDPFHYCLPGSLQDCTTTGAACPAGESCGLAFDPSATMSTAAAAYGGVCLTKLMADDYLPVGSACQTAAGPYACENQGGYLGSGCFAHRCTRACARTNDCPVGTQCLPPPYAAKLGGAVSFLPSSTMGTGLCLGRFCGQVHGEAGLALGQVGQQGADALCVTGEVCVPTMAVGATGDTQYLSCIPPRPAALAFGAACSVDPALGLRCADDSLCAERGGTHFCSTMCRVDGDCPQDSFCVEDYPSSPLPNGSVARLSMCTPRSLLPGTVCRAEKSCAATEACLPLNSRSSLTLCRPAVGPKSVGEPCAAGAECRSGECSDRDLRPPTGANRTSCNAVCGKNSDCGAGQICLRVVKNNNGTSDDPRDDIVVGVCTTLTAPALAGGCATDDNCTGQTSIDEIGGDTCDPTYRTCYTRAAHIGDPCAHRADCPLGAYCWLNDPRFPGGVCLSQGCDPLAYSGVDGCPAGAVCAQRATDTPLSACYPACSSGGSTCARAAEGFRCEAVGPAGSGSPNICILQGGP